MLLRKILSSLPSKHKTGSAKAMVKRNMNVSKRYILKAERMKKSWYVRPPARNVSTALVSTVLMKNTVSTSMNIWTTSPTVIIFAQIWSMRCLYLENQKACGMWKAMIQTKSLLWLSVKNSDAPPRMRSVWSVWQKNNYFQLSKQKWVYFLTFFIRGKPCGAADIFVLKTGKPAGQY